MITDWAGLGGIADVVVQVTEKKNYGKVEKMKTRVVKRWRGNLGDHYYEVDVWRKIFWKFGWWQTQVRTTDSFYAKSVFNEYKDTREIVGEDKVVLIHYE